MNQISGENLQQQSDVRVQVQRFSSDAQVRILVATFVAMAQWLPRSPAIQARLLFLLFFCLTLSLNPFGPFPFSL
jgi:hypothetical protein